MATSLAHKVIWVVIFAVAMGFLEAAVVVYLRELYYPNGFAFPLVVLDPHISLVEIGREAATVIMLAALGMLAGNNFRERLAFFLISFAVWDLCYYVFLKLTLDWPASLLAWDILFLIPVPWVGPVLSPILCCLTMLVLASTLLRKTDSHLTKGLTRAQWLWTIGGSTIMVLSWTSGYLGSNGATNWLPTAFNWWMFAVGEAFILIGIAKRILQDRTTSH